MRKKRTSKIFAKAFYITNADGKFTKEDFENLKEKFEVIRQVYFSEKENHDYYDGFRTITKEIKRAAHNAWLKADIANLEYKSAVNKFTCVNETSNEVPFNLIITIKGAAKYSRENHFVITGITGYAPCLHLDPNNLGEDAPEISFPITDDLRDEENPTYTFIEKDE